jgi:hypothetical protein
MVDNSSGVLQLKTSQDLCIRLERNGLETLYHPRTCQMPPTSRLLWEICNNLTGSFKSKSLSLLYEGATYADMLYLLRYWFWQNSPNPASQAWKFEEARKLMNEVILHHSLELRGLPMEAGTAMPYAIGQWANLGMLMGWLRVDNRSAIPRYGDTISA